MAGGSFWDGASKILHLFVKCALNKSYIQRVIFHRNLIKLYLQMFISYIPYRNNISEQLEILHIFKILKVANDKFSGDEKNLRRE